MQEPYLVPTECARPLPGPNPALPFPSKPISSSSHQGKPYQTGDSINRAPRARTTTRGMRQVPAGGRSSERPLPGAKASALAALAGVSPAFPSPDPAVWRRAAGGRPGAGQGGWQGALQHPSSPPRPQGTPGRLRGQRGEGMDQDTTLPPLNSSQRLNACSLPSRRLCQTAPVGTRP